jgi:hypothetical protein
MMHPFNNKKKNNILVTTATIFIMAFFVLSGSTIIGINQPAFAISYAHLIPVSDVHPMQTRTATTTELSKAPAVVSGDNIYIAWWTNNTENGNEEVMFRASTDGGATFGDKINLSNTTEADSWRVEIAGEGDNVVVSWWETNQTSDTPVARISNDGGQTFGPLLRLAANGTIGIMEGEGAAEEGETVEEEAVGGAEVAE